MGFKRQWNRIKYLPGASFHLYGSQMINGILYKKNHRKRLVKNWLAYQKYRTAVLGKLRHDYHLEIATLREEIVEKNRLLPHCKSKKIWVYWAQGFDHAPNLVKFCVQSVIDKMGSIGYEVVLLSDNNILDYVSFPNYILERYRAGSITPAFFSDLLRLNLLIQHGGVWLDATVLCSDTHIPSYMLESDLFLFCTTPSENRIIPTQIESFFICASSNNEMLIMCRELLYLYLKQHNDIADYFLIYEMFQLTIESFPEEWAKVIYYPRADIFTLADEVYKPYNPNLISILLNRFPFHKLSYKEHYEEGSAIDYLMKHSKLYSSSNNDLVCRV